MNWLTEYLLPVVVSFLCGSLLGMERELSHKPAGLRTQTLISIGTTLFVLAGKHLTPEPARVAASVLTGLGFLGGGVILQQRGAVRGLTTAAIIWVNGGLGVVIGLGGYPLAALGTSLTLAALYFLSRLERKIETKCNVQEYEIVSKESDNVLGIIRETLNRSHFQEKPLTFEKTEKGIKMRFAFCNSTRRHQEFVDKLRAIEDVEGVNVK